MSTITIDDVTASGSTLESTVTVPRSLRRFFAEQTFRATYEVDISNVDESILAIPVLSHVAPVAWASGANVSVPKLDRQFEACLPTIEAALKRMYPDFMKGGAIHVEETVESTRPSGDGTGLLFSGGVDSATSFARHTEEVKTLIGIQGWTVDIGDEDEWNEIERRTRALADRHGIETSTIRSNALSMLDTTMLQAHYKRYLVGSWYSGVGHGLGLLSLCAPLSVPEGLDHLFIASTHTDAFDYPWGSHPAIDDHVRWSGTTASHDGYELSRQEKIDRLAEFIERDPDLMLYTCNEGEGSNCSHCEKCYRTAVGLILAGVDPIEHGYDIRADDLKAIQEPLETGEWLVDEDVLFMWQDLQNHAETVSETAPPEVTEFFSWLAELDLNTCYERAPHIRDSRWGRAVRSAARRTPYPVYATLYPVFDHLRHLMG